MSDGSGSESDASGSESGDEQGPAWMYALLDTKWRPDGPGARDLAARYPQNDVRNVRRF